MACNFCTLEGLKKAFHPDGVFTFEPKPLGLRFPDGVDFYINGTWACWFASMPTECHCSDIYNDFRRGLQPDSSAT